MKIAILGWGSLVWNPGNLEIDETIGENGWSNDGPKLPIEFARISGGDRLSLVISTSIGTPTQALYTISNFKHLDQAVCDLFRREKCTKQTCIGYFVKKNKDFRSRFEIKEIIEEWLNRKKDIDAVIWTDLEENFKKKRTKSFSQKNVISYLKKILKEGKAAAAEEYIRKAPAIVNTPIRKAIENELGWTKINLT